MGNRVLRALLAAATIAIASPASAQDAPSLLDRIYFDSAEARLTTRARATLDPVARVASGAPDCHLRLVGRADIRGSAWGNRRLSEQRARAAATELERLGVAPERIEVVGHGEALTPHEPQLDELPREARLARQRRVDVFMTCPS